MSLIEQELLTFPGHPSSQPVFYWVRVALVFSFLCCGFFFVFVLCLACPMLPVSLDCLFLISPSVVSNVYLCGS